MHILKTISILIVFLTFIGSCDSRLTPIDLHQPDPLKSERQYAKFTYDYGTKGFAPVEMTNSDLTGGTLCVTSDPTDAANQCVFC